MSQRLRPTKVIELSKDTLRICISHFASSKNFQIPQLWPRKQMIKEFPPC
jgi:hypothetical protein